MFLNAQTTNPKKHGDEMLFADEKSGPKNHSGNQIKPWRVLIVDDEPEVHQITKLILNNAEFNQRPIEFLSAYSGQQAIEVLKKEDDIAVILLDVVMENPHAGLDTVKAIRQDLNNQMVRIILRTGQPGEAPDSEIILDYDINDYKEKSELTYNKLFTSVVASLRTYQQLCSIEQCRTGLKKIIEATANYCRIKSEPDFAIQLLQQVSQLLNLGDNSLYLTGHIKHQQSNSGSYSLLAGRGKFAQLETEQLQTDPQYPDLHQLIQTAFDRQDSQSSDKYHASYFISPSIGEHVIVIENNSRPVVEDLQMFEMFVNSTLSAFNNLVEGLESR